MNAAAGYADPGYAASLEEWGRVLRLPASGGYLLERSIPGWPHLADAMGCYPLFACSDWDALATDLECLPSRIVAVSLVADPFGRHTPELLEACFPDVARPFKEHLITDLERPPQTYVAGHHRRYARRAMRDVLVERCDSGEILDDWVALYSTLTRRHAITGLPAFSRRAFARQLAVPGLVALRATAQNETVGILLWYVQRDVAYYHLGAYSPAGYELRASFALFWHAIELFREHDIRWLDLGAGAGTDGTGDDGLTRFKRGWATGTRTAYFCGRIRDPDRYAEITAPLPATTYFPAYRAGEFAAAGAAPPAVDPGPASVHRGRGSNARTTAETGLVRLPQRR